MLNNNHICSEFKTHGDHLNSSESDNTNNQNNDVNVITTNDDTDKKDVINTNDQNQTITTTSGWNECMVPPYCEN